MLISRAARGSSTQRVCVMRSVLWFDGGRGGTWAGGGDKRLFSSLSYAMFGGRRFEPRVGLPTEEHSSLESTGKPCPTELFSVSVRGTMTDEWIQEMLRRARW